MENYRILLASPTDVSKERRIVDNVVKGLNVIFNKIYNANLQLITWENDTFPSIGNDAQDVINKQIGNNYEILLGIMWHKFGTPTQRYDSGTEEEFNNAYERYKKDNNSMEIKFYFNVNLPPKDFDEKQYMKVLNFKKNIQSKGVYTREYSSFLHLEIEILLALFFQIYKYITTIEYVSDNLIIVEEIEKRNNIFVSSGINLYNNLQNFENILKNLQYELESEIKIIKSYKVKISSNILHKHFDNMIRTIAKGTDGIKFFLENSHYFLDFIKAYTNLLFATKKSNDEKHKNYYLESKTVIEKGIEIFETSAKNAEEKINNIKSKDWSKYNTQYTETFSEFLNAVSHYKDEMYFVKDLLVNLKNKFY